MSIALSYLHRVSRLEGERLRWPNPAGGLAAKESAHVFSASPALRKLSGMPQPSYRSRVDFASETDGPTNGPTELRNQWIFETRNKSSASTTFCQQSAIGQAWPRTNERRVFFVFGRCLMTFQNSASLSRPVLIGLVERLVAQHFLANYTTSTIIFKSVHPQQPNVPFIRYSSV